MSGQTCPVPYPGTPELLRSHPPEKANPLHLASFLAQLDSLASLAALLTQCSADPGRAPFVTAGIRRVY